MWISAALDVIPIVGMGGALFGVSKQPTSPGFFPLLVLGVLIVSAIVAVCAWWKARAGQLLRAATSTAEGDGELLVRAFVLLRRYFAVTFVLSAVITVVALFEVFRA